MLSEELREKVDNAFRDKKSPLLGNTLDFTKDDISKICDEAIRIFVNRKSHNKFYPSDCKVFILAFVFLTREWGSEKDDETSWFDYITGRLKVNQKEVLRGFFYDRFNDLKNYFLTLNSTHKYYSTICCHALAPKSSILALIDICWDIYVQYLDKNYSSENKELLDQLVEAFKKRFTKSDENKDVNIGSQSYQIRIGIRDLTFEHPEVMASLLDEILSQIDSFFHDEKVSDEIKKDYLTSLVIEWSDKKRDEFARLRKASSSRRDVLPAAKDCSSIKPRYVYDSDSKSVYLVIPKFNVDESDPEPEITISNKGIVVRTDSLPIYGIALIRGTREKKYRLEELTGECDVQPLNVSIFIGGQERFNSRESLYRDFILFDTNGKEVTDSSVAPSEYLLYSRKLDGMTLPEDIYSVPDVQDLFGLNAKSGEQIRRDDHIVIFEDHGKHGSGVHFLYTSKDGIHFESGSNECRVIEGPFKVAVDSDTDIKNLAVKIEKISSTSVEKSSSQVIWLSEIPDKEVFSDGRQIFDLTSYIDSETPVDVRIFNDINDFVIRNDEHDLLRFLVIRFERVEIAFDRDLYYSASDRCSDASCGTIKIQADTHSWGDHFNIDQSEFKIAALGGQLRYDPPILKWRFDEEETHRRAEKFYVDSISNFTSLDVQVPVGIRKPWKVTTNLGEIPTFPRKPTYRLHEFLESQAVHDSDEVSIFLNFDGENYELLRAFMKPKFIDKDFINIDSDKRFIDVNFASFIGPGDPHLNLKIESADSNFSESFDLSRAEHHFDLKDLPDDHYRISISYSTTAAFNPVLEEMYSQDVCFGDAKALRFKGQSMYLKSVYARDNDSIVGTVGERHLTSIQYRVTEIEFLKSSDDGSDIYKGILESRDSPDSPWKPMDKLGNKAINPVRIVPDDTDTEKTTTKKCEIGYGLDLSDKDDYDDFDEFMCLKRDDGSFELAAPDKVDKSDAGKYVPIYTRSPFIYELKSSKED